MWSLGCVAVEMCSRRVLYQPRKGDPCAIDYLRLHLRLLGRPSEDAWAFLKQLPGLPCDLEEIRRTMGKVGCGMDASVAPQGQPGILQVMDFANRCLQWLPADRITAASASEHPLLSVPKLSVGIASEEGKHGPASLCSGMLHQELLDYLQKCPSWLTSQPRLWT